MAEEDAERGEDDGEEDLAEDLAASRHCWQDPIEGERKLGGVGKLEGGF